MHRSLIFVAKFFMTIWLEALKQQLSLFLLHPLASKIVSSYFLNLLSGTASRSMEKMSIFSHFFNCDHPWWERYSMKAKYSFRYKNDTHRKVDYFSALHPQVERAVGSFILRTDSQKAVLACLKLNLEAKMPKDGCFSFDFFFMLKWFR